MIAVNELRIGNYVSDIHASDSFYASVNKIHSDRIYYGNFHSNPTDIKPIPLTEEWLERFGFSDISEDCAGKIRNFKVFCKSYHVEKCTEQQTIFIYLGSRGWTFKRVGSPLYNYVHQLQNLYSALTGEELNLKES